jgi:methyl-accepting chemotaxis protein
MIVEQVQKTLTSVAQMSYESWVSILLAALAVLLALVTLIVAIAGIVVALLGIWGFRGLRKFSEQRVDEAARNTFEQYPDAADFMEVNAAMRELYSRMQQQMSTFKQEFEVLHQRSEDANAFLDRLSTKHDQPASNSTEATDASTDMMIEPMSAGYPGEGGGSDDSNPGKSITDEGSGSGNSR